MAERVDQILLLGAGASRGAREGRIPVPPDGSGLGSYLRRWYDANDPVHADPGAQVMMDYQLDPATPMSDLWFSNPPGEVERARLEAFLTAAVAQGFERAASHEQDLAVLRTINRLVAFALLTGKGCALPAQPDLLDVLVAPVPQESLAVFTLNYDMLIEEALARAGRQFYYPGPRYQGADLAEGVPIVKLHGSVGWTELVPIAVGANFAAVQEQLRRLPPISNSGPHGGMETHSEEVQLDRANAVMALKDERGRTPVLATYCQDKPIPVNFEAIDRARRAGFEIIGRNPQARAVVVGVHVPEHDHEDETLGQVLRAIGRRKATNVFINPSESECRAGAALGFQPLRLTLAQYLKTGMA